ncbi:FMRFamide receptor-like [Haliotis asinina]|uniref:FMRFamide receptor-like n=1 Tax=Haliotis asinina TaxID=109174 RepID=UPI003532784A
MQGVEDHVTLTCQSDGTPYTCCGQSNTTWPDSNSTGIFITKNYTAMNLAKAFFQARVFRIGYGYVLFIICFAGVCGNMLVFCVLTRKALRTSTTAVYLQVLALTDTLVLITSIFRYKSYKVLLTEKVNTEAVFYLEPYIEVYVEPFFWIFLGVSSFVTLLLSTERYLAVKYPLTMKRTCTVQLVSVCIVAVILIVTIITIPIFLSYEIRHIMFHDIQTTIASATYFGIHEHYVCTYTHYILPLVWYMFPWLLLAIINTLLALHVRRSSRIRVGIPNVVDPNRNLSLLIILVVLVYMVCNFPRCIISIMTLVDTNGSNCLKDTRTLSNPRYSGAYLVSVVVADILNVLNSCVNIFVYCFVGTKFRKELRKLILCQPCHKHTTVLINNTIQVTLTRSSADSLRHSSSPT